MEAGERMRKTVSFGATGQQVSCVGLGGEGVLRTVGREAEARAVIQAALDQGITYFDSARVYADSEFSLASRLAFYRVVY